MIPYDIDPSLHDSEPTPERLDDGFSPPTPEVHDELACEHVERPAGLTLSTKSPF